MYHVRLVDAAAQPPRWRDVASSPENALDLTHQGWLQDRATTFANLVLAKRYIDDVASVTGARASMWSAASEEMMFASLAPVDLTQHPDYQLMAAPWIDRLAGAMGRLCPEAEPAFLVGMAEALFATYRHVVPEEAVKLEYDGWPPHDD